MVFVVVFVHQLAALRISNQAPFLVGNEAQRVGFTLGRIGFKNNLAVVVGQRRLLTGLVVNLLAPFAASGIIVEVDRAALTAAVYLHGFYQPQVVVANRRDAFVFIAAQTAVDVVDVDLLFLL